MEVNPISAKRIYQNIIEQFVGLLKEGKLTVGQKFPPERQLAEMFKVSRASIREAFSAMEIIGLIEVRPGEGSFVTDINIGPFINAISPLFIKNENMEEELLELRRILEIEAVRLATQKADKLNFEMLESILKQLEHDDMIPGADADINFHKEIFKLSGNSILIKASECVAYILESSVKFNREKILKNKENKRVLYEQHMQIVQAIKAGDAALAAERMDEHICLVQNMI